MREVLTRVRVFHSASSICGAREGVIARPQLKVGGRHYLRLYAAHIAADGDCILLLGGVVRQMMTPQAEVCYRFDPNW